MRALTIGLLVLFFAFPSSNATAGMTEHELKQHCGKDPIDGLRLGTAPLDLGLCGGYINGTVDTLSRLKVICLPAGETNGQIITNVFRYISDHPETGDRMAVDGIQMIAAEAYPCTTKAN
jgi:hypothetical protein